MARRFLLWYTSPMYPLNTFRSDAMLSAIPSITPTIAGDAPSVAVRNSGTSG